MSRKFVLTGALALTLPGSSAPSPTIAAARPATAGDETSAISVSMLIAQLKP